MSALLQIMFQVFPSSIAILLLGLFAVLVILLILRIVKIVLDALPFV